MTTAEHFRDAVSSPASTVSIAGVDWPVYKVLSLLVGAVVFILVGLVAGAAAPAVLTATAVTAATWIVAGTVARRR